MVIPSRQVDATKFAALGQFAGAASVVALSMAIASNAAIAQGVPVHDWSGYYAGLSVGAARSNSDVSSAVCTGSAATCYFSGYGDGTDGSQINAASSHKIGSTDLLLGVQVGRNWQTGKLLLGVEVDLNSIRVSSSRAGSVPYNSSFPNVGWQTTNEAEANYLATLRGRIGYATGDLLLFATGGIAFTNFTHTHHGEEFVTGVQAGCSATSDAYCDRRASSKLRTGWTIGGGAELALDKNWSLRGEYLYAGFGRVASQTPLVADWIAGNQQVVVGGVPQTVSHAANFTVQTLRAGLNYKF